MARAKITNGTDLLPGIDKRSFWARRFRDLIETHTDDKGGPEACSEAEKAIIRRSVCLIVELEILEVKFASAGGASPFQLREYGRAANTLRRLLSSIGIERRSRDITPPNPLDYARAMAAAEDAAEDAAEGEAQP